MSCDDAEITANITFISTHFSLLFLLYFNATHFSETYPRVQINVLSKSRLNFFGPTGFFRGSLTSKCFFFSSDLAISPFYGNFLAESVFPFLDESQIESLVDFEMSHFLFGGEKL